MQQEEKFVLFLEQKYLSNNFFKMIIEQLIRDLNDKVSSDSEKIRLQTTLPIVNAQATLAVCSTLKKRKFYDESLHLKDKNNRKNWPKMEILKNFCNTKNA